MLEQDIVLEQVKKLEGKIKLSRTQIFTDTHR